MEIGLRIERHLRIILSIILVILPLITIYVLFHFRGPQWDLTAHSLLGKSLLNYLTHSAVGAKTAFVGEYLNNLIYYAEPYRAPLSTPIFALLSIFFAEPVLPYMILVYLGAVAALYKLGRQTGIDTLIIFSAFLNPYVLYFFFVPNGMEGLSIIFVLLALTLLYKKRSISGVFLAMASLAKYPALILLPLVLLLGTKKKIISGLIFEVATISPWLLFNYFVYGNPLYGYEAALSNAVTSGGYTIVHPFAVLAVIGYPLALCLIGIAAWVSKKKNKAMPHFRNKYKVFAVFFALSLIGYAFVLPHNDFFTQERFGYLFSTAFIIISASFLTDVLPKKLHIERYIAVAAIMVLVVGLYYTYITSSTSVVEYYNSNSPNNVYTQAYSELSLLGFGGCRFISNAWIPMLYQHMNAYSPFIRYSSKTITPIVIRLLAHHGINYTEFTEEQARYPIVVIEGAGVSPSLIIGLKNSTLSYNTSYIQIYLPKNVTCYAPTLYPAG